MTWLKAVTPKQAHDVFGVYHGNWMPEMDRCWIREEDGLMVCSRIIRLTEKGWGPKIEHVTITRHNDKEILWSEKQQIKNELFGENRVAIEVFPKESKLVDVMNVYHLWVFDKSFNMPFGIHPSEYQSAINRGSYTLSNEELSRLKKYYDNMN